jgi:hypothetical protein
MQVLPTEECLLNRARKQENLKIDLKAILVLLCYCNLKGENIYFAHGSRVCAGGAYSPHVDRKQKEAGTQI